jgi:hypothetical protein
MKKMTMMIYAVSIIFTLNAQKKSTEKVSSFANVGVGFNSYYSNGVPIGASYEKSVSEDITAGVGIDYLSSKYDYYYTSSYSNKLTALYIGVRAAYHFKNILNITNEKLDFYGGATVGYRRFTWKDTYYGTTLSGSYGSGIFLGGYGGIRYLFNKKTGAFIEAGETGSTNAKIGLTVNL